MNFRQYAGTPGNSRRASRCQQWIALCAVHVFAKAAALAFATSGSLSQKRRFSGDARRRAGCALASPKSLPKTHSRRLPLETPRTRRASRDRTAARSPGTAASGRDLPVAKCLSTTSGLCSVAFHCGVVDYPIRACSYWQYPSGGYGFQSCK